MQSILRPTQMMSKSKVLKVKLTHFLEVTFKKARSNE